jgi:hypothetical protein
LEIPATRKSGFYVLNIATFLAAIVSLSSLSFAFSPDDLPSRMNANLTLLLTAIAYKFVISETLPKINFVTALDKYLLFNFGFLYCILVENALMALISDTELRELIDSRALVLLVFVWVCTHLYVAFQSYRMIVHPRTNKKLLSPLRREYEEQWKMMLHRTHSATTNPMLVAAAVAKAKAKWIGKTKHNRSNGQTEHQEELSHPQPKTETKRRIITGSQGGLRHSSVPQVKRSEQPTTTTDVGVHRGSR